MNSKEYFFDRAIETLSFQNDKTIRVLELGSGTASYVPTLIDKYPALEYFGLEPIKESYDQALLNLKNTPRAKIVYQLGYDQIKGLTDASYDMVISFSVLEHVKHLDKFMELGARYLKPGGTMVHRYDLGHALYPGSLKERFHVWLGNTIPAILPETKFVRYVSLSEVEGHYARLGIMKIRHTHHQMPNHKRLEKHLKNPSPVMEEVYGWEFNHATQFDELPANVRERIFPTVAVWGKKK